MDKIKNAIIIHGPGRSGTTLLSSILSLHKDFYWISGYVNRYPQAPFLSIFNNFQQINKFESFSRGKNKFPRPAEAYAFWNHHFKEFNQSLGKSQKEEVENSLETINSIKKYSKGDRFITKITGSARADFIDSMFENPTILWIDRNPESVVMSYYKQRWNYKSRPSEFDAKLKTELIKEYVDKFKKIKNEKKNLHKFNFHQLFYEDLVSDPLRFFSTLCENLNLEMYDSFYDKVKKWDIYKGSNDSYKKLLNEEELKFMKKELSDLTKKPIL